MAGMDLWFELYPSRREMLTTLLKNDGVSETAIPFKLGDLNWGLERKLVATRPYRNKQEYYITPAGNRLLAAYERHKAPIGILGLFSSIWSRTK